MAETIAIVDYGAGNLRSVANALRRVAGGMRRTLEIVVTADPDQVLRSDRVVLPGVGAFGDCKAGLDAIAGMTAALEQVAIALARPFFGICVGMQLMARLGLEHGSHAGFGWIGGEVVTLGARPGPDHRMLKVPHMGWNTLDIRGTPAGSGQADGHPVLANLPANPHVYFVHSFHFKSDDPQSVLAETDYGGPIAAMIGRQSMVGTQFHPEKSQSVGLTILQNFLEWQP